MFCRISRSGIALLALAGSAAARCAEVVVTPSEHGAPCDVDAIKSHVLGEFTHYGPLSRHKEYFGYVYRLDGTVRSAVIEGWYCHDLQSCGLDTARAAALIPPGAKVLGEWHTHPWSIQSKALSAEDVLGANANSKIRCYTAFYSTFEGDIFQWDSKAKSVPSAMQSRTLIGNYREAGTITAPRSRGTR